MQSPKTFILRINDTDCTLQPVSADLTIRCRQSVRPAPVPRTNRGRTPAAPVSPVAVRHTARDGLALGRELDASLMGRSISGPMPPEIGCQQCLSPHYNRLHSAIRQDYVARVES